MRNGNHTISQLQSHIVWVTKYRYPVLKGRVSRKLQQEFPELSKRYWGKHFWAIGYGAWSTGNINDAVVEEYLEHHRDPSNLDNSPIILE